MRRPVGIVGWLEDEHVAYMVKLLEQAGAETVVLDTRHSVGLDSWRWNAGSIEGPGGERLEELGAVYVKAIALTVPALAGEVEGAELERWCAAYAEDRARYAFAQSALRALEERGIPFVNPLRTFWSHGAKAHAVGLLRRAGLPVPRTLVTCDPQAVRDFAARVGEVVFKPAGGGGSCRRLEAADLEPGRLELLRRAPCLFQELVPGNNIRVFVLDGQVISSTLIRSEDLDYRGSELGLEPIPLAPEVAGQAIAAARAFEMIFTGIDFRMSPSGQPVFLDVNPAPMFMGFEQGGVEPIGERLARHLVALAEQRQEAAA